MSRAPDVDYSDTSRRPDWDSLPDALHGELAAALGTEIVDVAAPVTSGFTGGFAARAVLADGRRVFVKASRKGIHAYDAYQREADVVPQLPASVHAPAVIATAHADDAFAVVSEWVDGRMPGTPWTPEDFERVTATCERMVEALHPNPLDGLSNFSDLVTDDIKSPPTGRQLPDGLQSWVPRILPELTDLIGLAPEALAGDSATHSDLRPDNLLIDDAGACWTLDWNWLAYGPRWIDWVGLLPLAQHHGIDTFGAVARSPLTADVPADHLDAFAAVIVAYMMKSSDAPPPPGCTRAVREHQRLTAWTFLDWLAVRRGWPTVET